MSSAALYRRLRELLPDAPQLVGDVQQVDSTAKTARVVLPGGGLLVARNAIGATVGNRVFVQDGAIIATGPALPIEIIEV